MALSSLSEAPSPSTGNKKASELPENSLLQHESSLVLENDISARILLPHFTRFDVTFEVELAAKIASHSSASEKSKRTKTISPPTLSFSSQSHSDYQGPVKLSSSQQDSDLPETQKNVSLTSSSKAGMLDLHPDTLLPDTQTGAVGTSQLPNGYGIERDSQLPEPQRIIPNQLASRQGTSFRLNPDMLLPDTQVGTVDASQIPNGCGIIRDCQMPETQGDVPKSLGHSNTSPRFNFDILLPHTQTDSRSLAYSSKVDEKSQIINRTCDPVGSNISGKEITSIHALQGSDSLLRVTQRSTILSERGNTRIEATKDLRLPNTQRDSQVSDLQAQQQLPHNKSQAANRCNTVSTSTEYSIIVIDDNSDIENENSSSLSPSSSHSSPTSAPQAHKDQNDPQHEDPVIFDKTSSSTPSINSSPAKPPANKLTVQERKRIVVSSSRPPALTTSLRLWIRTTHHLLDPFRSDHECWLHPSPPRGHLSVRGILRPCGKLQKRFIWQDRHGRHALVLNYGIVSKLVYHRMSKQQIDGFVNKHWHLSHLCGNWTCVNPEHTTVEPGSVNISRNNCFSHRSGCLHTPPCMKEMKVPLGADGKLVDHNASVASYEVRADEGDDWSVMSFEDGESSFVMDGDEDEKFSEDEVDGDGLEGGVEVDDF